MSQDIRAKFLAYPKEKFPIRMLIFDPSGKLAFDSGEINGFTAVEVPGLGPGGVRYSVTIFGDGEVTFNDDPTCGGTVNYAHDDMEVLGRLTHFIGIVQSAGRWFIEQSTNIESALPEDADALREFFERQSKIGELFLEGAEVTRKMLEDSVNREV